MTTFIVAVLVMVPVIMLIAAILFQVEDININPED